jgi:hypothetical protein
MSDIKLKTKVLQKGSAPVCLKSRRQCRGCFGWRNMLNAVHSDTIWQNYPIKCTATGLTLKVERKK